MIQEIKEELKSNPKFLYITGSLVIMAILVLSIRFMDFESSKQPLEMQNKVSLAPDAGIPDDLFASFKPDPLPERPKPPAPAPKERRTLDVSGLFGATPKKTPSLTDEEILRKRFKENRPKRGMVQVIRKNKQNLKLPIETLIIDVSKDEDFSSQGIGKEHPTYPVDLSRTLTVDKFIPAVLITEVKSELPSEKVLALIEQDVYAFHGEKILIPRGSKAVGAYEPLSEIDSERLMINWYRIITPDGINIKLNAELADGEGSAGSAGKVDNRIIDKYGTALLFSTLSAVAQLSIDTQSQGQSAAAEAFSNNFGDITAESIRNSLDILPRINLPKGHRFNISPLVDIWFSKPIHEKVEVLPLSEMKKGKSLELVKMQRNGNDPVFLTEKSLKNHYLPHKNNDINDNKESSSFANDYGVKYNDNSILNEEIRDISDEEFIELLNKI